MANLPATGRSQVFAWLGLPSWSVSVMNRRITLLTMEIIMKFFQPARSSHAIGKCCSPRQQGAGFARSCYWWHWVNHDLPNTFVVPLTALSLIHIFKCALRNISTTHTACWSIPTSPDTLTLREAVPHQNGWFFWKIAQFLPFNRAFSACFQQLYYMHLMVNRII